jgi:hypothetical protein
VVNYRAAAGSLLGIVTLVTLSCAATSPSPTTGLTGTVTRGPVTPVCRVDVPCDAPFSSRFTVQQGGTLVAQFQSDQAGQFTVFLQPGAYTVVPAADAPIISPERQAKPVTVANNGQLTVVQLTFDTGIR